MELLMVMALIGILSLITVPVVSSMSRGRAVTTSAYALHDLLEYARAEAMARNTYTWVGFANVPSGHTSNKSGSHQVVVASFSSLDGTASASSALLKPLARPVTFKNIKIVPNTAIDSGVRDQLDATTALSLASASTPKPLPVTAGVTFTQTITFTPQGLAMVKAVPTLQDGFDEAVDIGIVQMSGDAELPGPNDACVRISGGAGTSQIYRLQ